MFFAKARSGWELFFICEIGGWFFLLAGALINLAGDFHAA